MSTNVGVCAWYNEWFLPMRSAFPRTSFTTSG
jgi:hypothetical protein